MTPIIGITASSITASTLGDYQSIATSVLNGNAASITFSSIPQTYTHLQIRFMAMSTNAANGQYGQFRVGNGSVDTGSNYAMHGFGGIGSGNPSILAAANQTYGRLFGINSGTDSNDDPDVGIMDILDYRNTNKFKTFRILTGSDSNGVGAVNFQSSLWRSTSAIDVITLYAFSQGVASNWAANTHFALYGIK